MAAPAPLPTRRSKLWQRVLISLLCAALVAWFVGLGVWQLERRAWKLDLMERVSLRLKAPAVALPAPAEWPGLQARDFEYRHVQVQGTWLHHKTVLTQATTALGQGFWVITPLLQNDGTAVLVNRGFVPSQQRTQWTPSPAPASAADEMVNLQGLMRKTEPDGGFLRHNDPQAQRWYSRDVRALASALQLPATAPFFVDAGLPDATVQPNPEAPRADTGPWPREGLTIVRFSNTHLVYALTWFALAAMTAAAGVYGVRHARP